MVRPGEEGNVAFIATQQNSVGAANEMQVPTGMIQEYEPHINQRNRDYSEDRSELEDLTEIRFKKSPLKQK